MKRRRDCGSQRLRILTDWNGIAVTVSLDWAERLAPGLLSRPLVGHLHGSKVLLLALEHPRTDRTDSVAQSLATVL